VAQGSLRTAEMTTPRVGCRKHTSQSALDPKHRKKEQMHGPANNLNVATWMYEWGYYGGVRIALTLFYIFCPVGNVLAIRTISLGLAGGTENIERLEIQ